jgi:hypothetical protein
MSTFTIQDPEIDFEVIDGADLGAFDGLGDEVFDTFNTRSTWHLWRSRRIC